MSVVRASRSNHSFQGLANGDDPATIHAEANVIRARAVRMAAVEDAARHAANGTNRIAAHGAMSAPAQSAPIAARRRGGWPPVGRLSASRLLALQALTGNRTVVRALGAVAVQRRPAQALIDKRIALPAAEPQVVDDELVPIGEAPGRFEGFTDKDIALELARRSPEVAVVVRDPDRYHVLRTTATTLGSKAAGPENPKGWVIVAIVEPVKRSSADTFERAYNVARGLSGDAQADAFRQMLVTGTHLELSETAWATSETNAAPGKVNVALWLPSRGRTIPPKVVPTGTAELPRVAILIGRTPFSEGAVSLRSTVLHESRHAYHMVQTLDLVRRWREKRKRDTLAAWGEWLKSQRKAIGPEVYQTAWANTDPGYGTATTETYSHFYGFVYRFRRDGDALKDPSALNAKDTLALHVRMAGLSVLGEHWQAAAQDARETTMDQLATFAAELTANQRQHLRNFMAKSAGAGRDAPKNFYREFTKRL